VRSETWVTLYSEDMGYSLLELELIGLAFIVGVFGEDFAILE
jgi:hypothetical protein